MSQRPSWDEYFLRITREVAQALYLFTASGRALLVMDKHILTTGYNGAPSGLQHCLDIGCLREQLKVPPGERHELCRGLHAEMNALLQASHYGIKIAGATLYSTTYPCSLCAKMLVNAGIKRIVTLTDYPDALAKEILTMASIKVEFVKLDNHTK